jgi:hypothetical protein
MGSAGAFVAGIILLLIGVGIFFFSQSRCNSLGGSFGQFIDPVYQQQCTLLTILGAAFGLIGFVAALAGGIGLAVRGSRSRKENKGSKIETYDVQTNASVREIFCRYCGKKRPISQDFCSICGRSSHATSTGMKKCTVCKATMSDDSNYCANCDQKFEEKLNSSEENKRYYYTSDGKKKERSSLQDVPKTEVPASPHLPENDLINYENLNLGIKRIQYPPSWSIKEIENNQVHFYPQESETTEATDKAPLEVWIALHYANKNILDSKHIEKRIGKIQRAYEPFDLLHSDNNATLSGIPAYKIVYKGRSRDKGFMVKKIEMGTIVNYIEYIINAGSDENTYSVNLPTLEKMISSLELTKTVRRF